MPSYKTKYPKKTTNRLNALLLAVIFAPARTNDRPTFPGLIVFPHFADAEVTSEASFTHMWHQQKQRIKALEEKYQWKLNEAGVSLQNKFPLQFTSRVQAQVLSQDSNCSKDSRYRSYRGKNHTRIFVFTVMLHKM